MIAQQDKLEDVEYLVKNIFENTRTEVIYPSMKEKVLLGRINKPAVVFLGEKPELGNAFILAPKNIAIIISLDNVPIKESLRLQFHLFAQPPTSYFIIKNNILWFQWGQSEKSFKSQTLYASYVVDTKNNSTKSELSIIDGFIAIDGDILRVGDIENGYTEVKYIETNSE